MYELDIDESIVQEAERKSRELGTLRNSITGGQGNLAGFVGEVLAQRVIGGTLENTYDYDLVSPSGVRVDVKTKRTTVKPKPFYNCSVADFNTTQNCDYYCFVRVHENMKVGWFLGVYPKDDFYRDATFNRKGEPDGPRFKFTADCYNIRIDQLLLPKDP